MAQEDKKKPAGRREFIISLILYTLGTFLCCVARYMETGSIVAALFVLVSFLYLTVVFILYGIFRVKAYQMGTLLVAFIFGAFTLGIAMRLYAKIWWYDLLVHGVSGVFLSLAGLCLCYYLGNAGGNLTTVFCFCFAMTGGALWEIVEYVLFLITGIESQHVATTGVGDTMEDLMICLFGAVIFAILHQLYIRKGWFSWLFVPAEQFKGNS